MYESSQKPLILVPYIAMWKMLRGMIVREALRNTIRKRSAPIVEAKELHKLTDTNKPHKLFSKPKLF